MKKFGTILAVAAITGTLGSYGAAAQEAFSFPSWLGQAFGGVSSLSGGPAAIKFIEGERPDGGQCALLVNFNASYMILGEDFSYYAGPQGGVTENGGGANDVVTVYAAGSNLHGAMKTFNADKGRDSVELEVREEGEKLLEHTAVSFSLDESGGIYKIEAEDKVRGISTECRFFDAVPVS